MSAYTSGSKTATGSVTLTKPATDTLTLIQLSGTYGTVTWVVEGSFDSTNYFALAAIDQATGALVTGTIGPSDNATAAYKVPSEGLGSVRARVTAIASGSADFVLKSEAFVGSTPALISNLSSLSGASGAGVGYSTGAGGSVTQTTSRTTGVTLNKLTGKITTDTSSLAAGAEAEFTVTNSTVAATDVVVLSITPGGTGTPQAYVSAVAAGSFKVSLTNLHASTADTSADVIQFAVIKAVIT